MRNDKDNLIVNKSFEFALKIIAFSEEIRQINRFEMASQIFRCGTSIGANIREAQNAESKVDLFINLKLQLKKLMRFSIG
jgi:four helix bundle protein